MKKLFTFAALFLLFTSASTAQIEEPLLTDTMTLAQAKYALQEQMATIEYYYFQDYYGKDIEKARQKYYYDFTRQVDAYQLLSRKQIVDKIQNPKRRSTFSYTNSGTNSNYYINHDLTKKEVNSGGIYAYHSLPHRTHILKVYYANGTVEEDRKVLQTEAWYQNYKPIDSILVDASIVYPIATHTMTMSVLEAQKNDLPSGGFIWLINYYDDRLSLAITENISKNVGSLQIITKDTKRYKNSNGVYVPYQPSTEMYSYANDVYMHCSVLVNAINRGLYKSTKALIAEHERGKPTPPLIQKVDRFSCKIPQTSDSIEVVYYTAMDSVVIKNMLVKESIARKCDYGIASISSDNGILYGIVDLDGRWVVRPSSPNGYLEEVAGIFYREYSNDFSQKSFKLLAVNRKKGRIDSTPYEVFDVFDNTFLLVEDDMRHRGILHRSGKELLKTEYLSIHYDSTTRYFIAKMNTEPSTYMLFNEKGKKLLPKPCRNIEIKNGTIYTTEIVNGEQKTTTYDYKMKKFPSIDF